MLSSANTKKECNHCNQECSSDITSENGQEFFCCFGCKVVYELLEENADFKERIKETKKETYAYLNHPDIKDRLLEFKNDSIEKIRVHLPQIHCSSCIFLLENLSELNPGILQVTVAFSQRNAEILYQNDKISLAELAALLDHIGYQPDFTFLDKKKQPQKQKHKILFQLGMAGFFFGNTMLLALPEYLHANISLEYGLIRFFHFLMMVFSIPVLTYSARDYFVNSYQSLRAGILSIDLPIVIGVSALFIRSVYEVVTQTGSGYFDSLNGLVFFLLLGKWYQQKTYDNFAFDRDYRAFLPLATTLIKNKKESPIPIDQLQINDHILVRAGEVIPSDGQLLSPGTQIDYSYITGESVPVEKLEGDSIYAGGKIIGKPVELSVSSTSDKSYLSSLWAREDFNAEKSQEQSFTDKISQYFTPAILSIALIGGLAWSFVDSSKSILVFTAVLIVACPCALALAEPFASGSTMRWFGRFGFFLKNTAVLNKLATIDQVIFDKTGTLTQQSNVQLKWNGSRLQGEDLNALFSGAKSAQHPLARSLQNSIPKDQVKEIYLKGFKEFPSEGIEFETKDSVYRIGKASFIGCDNIYDGTALYINKNGVPLGSFSFYHQIRTWLPELISELEDQYELAVLSGDNDSEKTRFIELFGNTASLHFDQNPSDKLDFMQDQKQKQKKSLMIGDGLNDAGALQQSHVGISLCEENVNFFPASDALLKATSFHQLSKFLSLSRSNAKIVKRAFAISLIYNLLGLSFALSGILSPLICAILMPISSATVVIYTTTSSRIKCNQALKNSPLGQTS